jgi:hypothetical protein
VHGHARSVWQSKTQRLWFCFFSICFDCLFVAERPSSSLFILLHIVSVFAFGIGVLQVTLSCSRIGRITLRIASRKCVRDLK